MKLGISIGYSGAQLDLQLERVLLAERLGYDSVWTAEAYGSDALTPLAYLAARTRHLRLGSGIMQMAARAPAAAAMAMQTLDALAGGGRVVCGIGASGPQIVEGWYGQPWGRPYHRLRDYVQVVRKVFDRREPVTHAGTEISVPYAGPGASGLGKPLTSILHTNPDLPIWLGTGGDATVRLTAELADGWLPLAFTPASMDHYRPILEEGFARAGCKSFDDFEIQPNVYVIVADDPREGFTQMKPSIALYVGGMGHRNANFHSTMMANRGYGDAAERIQDLYLAGRRDEAIAAVPDDYCDDRALVGSPARIRERYGAWEASGITGMTVLGDEEAMYLMADIVDLRSREH